MLLGHFGVVYNHVLVELCLVGVAQVADGTFHGADFFAPFATFGGRGACVLGRGW